MSDPLTIVTDFLTGMSDTQGVTDVMQRYFKPETVWENVGLVTTTGPEEAVALMNGMGMHGFRIEILAAAVVGRTVLTERIDYLLGEAGETRMELRVMGALEVDIDGKITRWTDYFDTAPFRQA